MRYYYPLCFVRLSGNEVENGPRKFVSADSLNCSSGFIDLQCAVRT